MPKAYSGDLRERVIEAVETGASRHDAAKRFEVSVSSAIKWLQRWHESRSAAPKPRGGSVSPLEEFATAILALVELSPSSLTAIRAWLPRFPSVFFGEIFPVIAVPPFNAVVETGALSISLSSLAPNSAEDMRLALLVAAVLPDTRYGRGYGRGPVYNGWIYDSCAGYRYGPGYGYNGCPGYGVPSSAA